MRTENAHRRLKRKTIRRAGVQLAWVELGQLKSQIVCEREAGVRNVRWSKTRRFPSRDR